MQARALGLKNLNEPTSRRLTRIALRAVPRAGAPGALYLRAFTKSGEEVTSFRQACTEALALNNLDEPTGRYVTRVAPGLNNPNERGSRCAPQIALGLSNRNERYLGSTLPASSPARIPSRATCTSRRR